MEEETKANFDERFLQTGNEVENVLETTFANPSMGFCCKGREDRQHCLLLYPVTVFN